MTDTSFRVECNTHREVEEISHSDKSANAARNGDIQNIGKQPGLYSLNMAPQSDDQDSQRIHRDPLLTAQHQWARLDPPAAPAQLAQAAMQARALEQAKCLKSRQRPAAQQVRQDQASVP